jgi:tetratricopeptide (TPR) repeat protein
MKAISILSLFLLVTPLFAETATAPANPEAVAVQKNLLPNQQAFLNLPEESRSQFIKALGDANRLFQQKRIFETFASLEKAAKIFPDSPEIYNLRGSCLVEMRSFDKALADFEKARSLSPDNISIDFNIAEVYFVTKQWKKCADLFDKVLHVLPAENTALSRLIEFKILLCKEKLGLKNDVVILSEKYDFLDDSPYYYYAQASLSYAAKDQAKAQEWLAIAGRVFTDPNILAPWQDTLVEYGYIKSFYGDDSSTAD